MRFVCSITRREKIVVLGAIERGAESAHLLDQFAADEREMADIIAGEKIVGRPIRFKNGRIEASLSQFVFVRVNHIRVGMVLNPFHVLKKRIRLE